MTKKQKLEDVSAEPSCARVKSLKNDVLIFLKGKKGLLVRLCLHFLRRCANSYTISSVSAALDACIVVHYYRFRGCSFLLPRPGELLFVIVYCAEQMFAFHGILKQPVKSTSLFGALSYSAFSLACCIVYCNCQQYEHTYVQYPSVSWQLAVNFVCTFFVWLPSLFKDGCVWIYTRMYICTYFHICMRACS